MDIAPKSSGGETKDGSSSVTEPMEASTGVAFSLLGKRKVESSNSEDSGESDGDGKVEEDLEDSDPDWDKDSFDGLEYHPSDDDGEYVDEDLEKRTRFYHRTVIETKGFFEPSDEMPHYLWAGITTVWDLDKEVHPGVTCRQFLADMACLCLEKYNKRKGFNVKFEHILRANFDPAGFTKYYITFAARESDSADAPLVEYQAKAGRSAGKTYPILCRPSPTPNRVEEEINSKVMEEGS